MTDIGIYDSVEFQKALSEKVPLPWRVFMKRWLEIEGLPAEAAASYPLQSAKIKRRLSSSPLRKPSSTEGIFKYLFLRQTTQNKDRVYIAYP